MKYLLNLRKTYPTLSIILGTLIVVVITLLSLRYFIGRPIASLPTEITTYRNFLGFSRPIDTSIKETKGEYQYENTQNTYRSSFKSTPLESDAVRFSYSGSTLSFYTPGEQSFGNLVETSPRVEDNSITYPEVAPSLDLRYTVEPTRLLEEFIVQNASTAATLTDIKQLASTMDISSYAQENGAIRFYSKNLFGREQIAFALPVPVMYELADKSNESRGIEYQIEQTSDTDYVITKVITEEGKSWMADSSRVYPIAIDLVIDNADTASSWVSSDPTNTTVSQETTIKQEGTGSVKIQTTGTTTATIDLMEYTNDTAAQSAYVTTGNPTVTGGTITSSGGYTIHTFTTTGTTSISTNSPLDVEYLVVAGGGGGGSAGGRGGGGGAGGMRTGSLSLSSGSHTVTVGGGGSPGSSSNGTNGGDSVFSTITSTGGGGGGSQETGTAARVGGSGGGGAANVNTSGAAGTAGQGNSGGSGTVTCCYTSGAGGGAGAAAGFDSALEFVCLLVYVCENL